MITIDRHMSKGVPLDNDTLRRLAPSVFAESKHSKMSDRYGFIPTSQIIEGMREAGWFPITAKDQLVRLDDRRGFTRHIVRLRQTNGQELLNVGDSVPEIVLVNSHDGTSAYQLHAGIFRLVCSNGLVIADSTFSKISIRHSGDVVGRVIDATSEVVREIPRIASGIRTMQAIELSPSEREAFAASALSLRESAISLEPAHLLHVRRAADSKPDLWSTFNVVQENLIRGGLFGRDSHNRFRRTRAVNSINEDTRLNKALWALTEHMATLKAA
jgi:hypothetical protein